MTRRLLGFVLALGAGIVSLLVTPTPAHADGEIYQFTSATHIRGEWGSYTGSAEFSRVSPVGEGERYFTVDVGNGKGPWGCYALQIANVVPSGTPGIFNGRLNNLEERCDLDENIKIYDPNNVKGTGSAKPPEPPKPDTENIASNCNAGPHFTWLICGAIKSMMGVVDWIRDNIIVPFLKEPPLDRNEANIKPVYAIWSAFRNVASVFFILVFFLIIFGTAIGWDNYTVKKILPRLVAGAVLVPFSWYICAMIIDIGNILGQGIVSLTSSIIPPPNIDFTSSLSKAVLGGVLIGATLAATTALATIGIGVVTSMLLAFLAVFFTLVLRKILIILLVVISPFALLAWILPNTEKFFKEWWTNFFKLVMMYPIIMLLFEAGRLFAATAGVTSGNTAEKGVVPLFQLVGLTLPLFGVPFAFAMAGKGLAMGKNGVGKLSGALNKRYGKDSDMAKERAEHRRLNNARRALDFANNPLQNSGKAGVRKLGMGLGAARRGLALKRSGLGGFTGHSGIPILKNNPAQKQRINAAGAKAEADEAQSRAQDESRRAFPQTSKERVESQTAAAFDKLFDSRVAEAAARKVPSHENLSIRETPLDPAGTAWLKEQVRTGDDATKTAALQRLSNSQGSIDAIMDLRTGEKLIAEDMELKTDAVAMRATKLADGTTVAAGQTITKGTVVKGGSYLNESANEEGATPNFRMVDPSQRDTQLVDPKLKTVWDKGTASVGVTDAKKSIAQAATDISADDVAGMSNRTARRYLDYYQRNYQDPDVQRAAREFNVAFQEVMASKILKGKILPETVNVVYQAGSMGNPAVSAATVQVAAAGAAQAVPRTVSAEASQAILAATGHDIPRASEIHQQIQNELQATQGASSTLRENIENKLIRGEPVEAGDFAHVPRAAAPSSMPAGVQQELAERLGNNLDQLSAIHREYEANENYRPTVHEQILNEKTPPAPPRTS